MIVYISIEILEILNHVSPSKTIRNSRHVFKGTFGTPVAFYGVYEAQGRGTLHIHFLLWGGIPPQMLQRISHNPTLASIGSAYIDQGTFFSWGRGRVCKGIKGNEGNMVIRVIWKKMYFL